MEAVLEATCNSEPFKHNQMQLQAEPAQSEPELDPHRTSSGGTRSKANSQTNQIQN